MRWHADMQAELATLAEAGLQRRRRILQSPQGTRVTVDGQTVLSFCSNDYLGLAQHPALVDAVCQGLQQAGVGSGASHLITGHHQFHQQAEQAFANVAGFEDALLFANGYMANLGVITALVGRHDAIFADKLNHASLNDAAILSRAELHRYAHVDMSALEHQLQASTAKRKLVVTDSVFSMDGDIAPLPAMLTLCERYDAYLMVDDAHGFGVLGKRGAGALSHFDCQHPRLIYMATLGKAAGVAGAFVAADAIIIAYLLQKARTYIYTTASPPALSAGLLKALQLITEADPQRQHLAKLIQQLRAGTQGLPWRLLDSDTAIQALIVGENQPAWQLSTFLLSQQVLVPAIRPPTVPQGTARLRISLSAAHTSEDIQQLLAALHQAAVAGIS